MPRSERSLRLAVADVYPGFDVERHPASRLVAAALGIAPTDVGTTGTEIRRADLVLYSVFGHDHLTARGTQVAFSTEPVINEATAQWTVDWRYRALPTHLRMPVWAYEYLGKADYLRSLPDPTDDDASQRRFCNFIYSNPHCGTRNAFFTMLDRHLHVDALGRVHHNADHPKLGPRLDRDWSRTKLEVLRDYRFTIAFENEEHPGYTTEKMIHAWAAGSVPVYWGNPLVDIDFPPGSYLSLYEAGTATRLVEQVLEAHHDPARLAQLRAANPFRTGHMVALTERLTASVDAFIARVIEDAQAHRGSPRVGRLRRVSRWGRFVRKESRARLISMVLGR